MSRPHILTCPDWGARPPKSKPVFTSRPASRIIFHHTAGHHPDIGAPNGVETVDEAKAYARAIQDFHMDDPKHLWNDSGHNFLVCRNGSVLQGRWKTVSRIQAEKMVVSAHCPGQNTQIGIEHEHDGSEPMTAAQFEAAAWIQAWIAHEYRLASPLPVEPHRKFYATSCPGVLVADIPRVRARAAEILRAWR